MKKSHQEIFDDAEKLWLAETSSEGASETKGVLTTSTPAANKRGRSASFDGHDQGEVMQAAPAPIDSNKLNKATAISVSAAPALDKVLM